MKERGIRISWRAVLLGSGMGLLSMICAAAAAAALMAGGVVGLDRIGLDGTGRAGGAVRSESSFEWR